jgi:hypothetical protein
VKRRLKRAAIVLGASFVTLGLSGCSIEFCGPSQILTFLFCDPHGFFGLGGGGTSPGGPSRAAGVSAAAGPAAPSLAFTAQLSAATVAGRPGTQTQTGDVRALRGAVISGSFRGKVPAVRGERRRKARALLAALLMATWRGRLDGSIDARTGARRADVLALATLPRRRGQRRADRACLRIAIKGANGRDATGTFTLLGGTGATGRLALNGTFAYGTGKLGSVAGTARVRTRAPRALPATCAALRT